MRLDNPLLVQWEYASEERLAKRNAVPPRTLRGVLSCSSPTCVSVRERDSAPSIFFLSGRSPLRYRCKYCGTELAEKEISSQLG